MNNNARIYVAGHRGLVGSALVRRLQAGGYTNLLMRTHAELDLTQQQAVQQFFENEKPEYVFLAAAKVGGIHANATYPAEFIYQNLLIETNLIHAAHRAKVKKTPVSRVELHLSQTRPTANERRTSSYRFAGTDQ